MYSLSPWLVEQEVQGLILGLATTISEIDYPLLLSRDMVEICTLCFLEYIEISTSSYTMMSSLPLLHNFLIRRRKCNAGGTSYKKKLKSLYILEKKCPDRHKNLDYWYLLNKYNPNTQIFDFFFCWYRGFCHRTESDLFLFLFTSSMKSLRKCEIWTIDKNAWENCPLNCCTSICTSNCWFCLINNDQTYILYQTLQRARLIQKSHET